MQYAIHPSCESDFNTSGFALGGARPTTALVGKGKAQGDLRQWPFGFLPGLRTDASNARRAWHTGRGAKRLAPRLEHGGWRRDHASLACGRPSSVQRRAPLRLCLPVGSLTRLARTGFPSRFFPGRLDGARGDSTRHRLLSAACRWPAMDVAAQPDSGPRVRNLGGSSAQHSLGGCQATASLQQQQQQQQHGEQPLSYSKRHRVFVGGIAPNAEGALHSYFRSREGVACAAALTAEQRVWQGGGVQDRHGCRNAQEQGPLRRRGFAMTDARCARATPLSRESVFPVCRLADGPSQGTRARRWLSACDSAACSTSRAS